MQTTTWRVLTLAVAASASLLAQAPAAPKYDVVSIKRNLSNALGSNASAQRPDGGLVLVNVPIGTLIGQSYDIAPVDMEGLPGWAMSERYDVSATSPVPRATPEQRTAMMRALLAERLQLVARVEQRAQPVYALVLARADGTLGPNIMRVEKDCEAEFAAQRAAAEKALAEGSAPPRPAPPDFNAPPSCTVRFTGDRMEAEQTIPNIARLFRGAAGRVVVDRTGLKGTYRMTMQFDRMGTLRGPSPTPATGDGTPSIFTAVQEQLGMKLESATAPRDVLVIERIERPTEN